ncbi:MAG: DUF364 domain-containing protein [Polyangiaceae bacterium]
MTRDIYDLLVSRARSVEPLRRMLLGLNWSVAQVQASGLCFSPIDPPRTLRFPGTLAGRPAEELAPWIRSFDPCEAAVGCAVINAVINHDANACLRRAVPLASTVAPHLAVFDRFSAETKDAHVVVVGQYPGLDELWRGRAYTCLERRPSPGTLPDTAAESLLPKADWVFLTASALANKTLPRLLELSRPARVVLMGPSLPWVDEWGDFGVEFLAGAIVRDAERLFQIAGEGGGTRIFDDAIGYRLHKLA